MIGTATTFNRVFLSETQAGNRLARIKNTTAAARYCADLEIREAAGAMEDFLEAKPGHFSEKEVLRQLDRLRASLRGGG